MGGDCNIMGAFSGGGGGGGATVSSAIVESQSNFTTTATSPVSVTNYSLTLPNTSNSNDCLVMFSGVMINSVSDAYDFELYQSTTKISATTCEPTTPYGHNSVVLTSTITDADGATLVLKMGTAGGNSGTFKSGSTLFSPMLAYAVS